jgi:membrane protein YdbS with pleckstrin-like domain
MTSDQAFILGISSLLIGTMMATAASWMAGSWLWGAVAVLTLGAVLGVYGLIMLWRSWRLWASQATNLCHKNIPSNQ